MTGFSGSQEIPPVGLNTCTGGVYKLFEGQRRYGDPKTEDETPPDTARQSRPTSYRSPWHVVLPRDFSRRFLEIRGATTPPVSGEE